MSAALPLPTESPAEPADCAQCARDAERDVFERGPSHNGSRACRNMRRTGHGAIAAGGTVAHCSCSGCC